MGSEPLQSKPRPPAALNDHGAGRGLMLLAAAD